jgi:hypothetical protein
VTAERRVPPNPDAPRVGGRKAARLAEADALSAEGYDALEEVAEKVAELVRERLTDELVRDLEGDEYTPDPTTPPHHPPK